MRKFIGKVRAAIERYNMINHDDIIAVGVSGGKDSLALIYALNEIKKYYPIKFEIKALTLDPYFNGKETDYSEITNFLSSLGIEHIIKRVPVWEIVFETRKEKNPCSLCSRMRRGILHNLCLEHNCTSIALGHHLDDSVQTFFMNLLDGGNIKCFSPVSYLTRKKINMIRPMIFCEEKEIIKVCKTKKFPICKNICPVEGKTERDKIKYVIFNLEAQYPGLRKKLINSLQNANISGW